MEEKTYAGEIKKAMNLLSQNNSVIFLGQTVEYGGSRFTKDLEYIGKDKKLELPVAEEMQMGISTGLAIGGFIPVSIYPRFDFLLLAANQLVNHLDKLEELSHGQFTPKVIIRTIIGSKYPFNPGAQHCQDYTNEFKSMLKNIYVKKLDNLEEIVSEYQAALTRKKPSLLIEVGDFYTKQ